MQFIFDFNRLPPMHFIVINLVDAHEERKLHFVEYIATRLEISSSAIGCCVAASVEWTSKVKLSFLIHPGTQQSQTRR